MDQVLPFNAPKSIDINLAELTDSRLVPMNSSALGVRRIRLVNIFQGVLKANLVESVGKYKFNVHVHIHLSL